MTSTDRLVAIHADGTLPARVVESVQDIVAAFVTAGANVTKTYDDNAGTLTLAATGGGAGTTDPEVVRDTIAASLSGTNGVTVTANDAADTIVVGLSGLTISQVTGLQTALNGLAPLASPTFTGTVSGVTAAMVGLGNVNNTADAAKPVSTAQAAAIAAKLDAASARTGTTATVRALGTTPTMAPAYAVTIQASSGALDGATSTVVGTLMTPSWQASTVYPAGAQVLHPTDIKTVLRRTASGTSRATYDATEQALWTSLPAGAQATFPIRYNCAFLYRKHLNGFDAYGPRGPKRSGDAQETDTTINGTQWSVDFDWYTAGGALEVPVYSSGQVRFIVDGQYVAATPTFQAGADDFQWRNVKLSGVPTGYHHIRVEVGGVWCWIGGVRVATADKVYPPSLPGSKKFCVVGDSYVEGVTGVASSGVAVQDLRGYPGILARQLGFTDYSGLGISATGFTNVVAGSAYADRLADVIALQPDYLLIQGSGNDNPNKATTLAAAALSFYQAVKAGCPNTKIVASGVPGWTATPANSDAMTATLAAQAATAGIDFIDTIGWGATVADLIADSNHPSFAGAEYLAARYAVCLGAKWDLPLSDTALRLAAGIPAGGTTGQVLAKSSGTNYATNWVDLAAGGGSLQYPQLVSIPWSITPTASSGTLPTPTYANATPFNGIIGNSASNQNTWYEWTFVVDAGTYTFAAFVQKQANNGIARVILDGVDKGTIDGYAASFTAGVRATVTGIALTAGRHTLRLQMDNKNASSTGYGFTLHEFSFSRTGA